MTGGIQIRMVANRGVLYFLIPLLVAISPVLRLLLPLVVVLGYRKRTIAVITRRSYFIQACTFRTVAFFLMLRRTTAVTPMRPVISVTVPG